MFEEDDYLQALLTIHEGLPRGGPGSDAVTRTALGMLPDLPEQPRVLDLGCGPGKQTLVLAEKLRTRVTAVDIFDVFLQQLKRDAEARGLDEFIKPIRADMAELTYPPRSWDLIWSEGAIYIVGFEKGLRMCWPWLAPGGCLAVTECTWLKEGAPRKLVDFWRDNYPAMQHIAGNLKICRQAGFEVISHFVLDDDNWLEHYYGPLLPRLDTLEAGLGDGDEALAAAITDIRREIALFQRYSVYYGYVFYLLRVEDDTV